MTHPDWKPWPEQWAPRFNAGIRCDMLVGPCACGATHYEPPADADDCDCSDPDGVSIHCLMHVLMTREELASAIRAAVEVERETCAQTAEHCSLDEQCDGDRRAIDRANACEDVATAIRARKDSP